MAMKRMAGGCACGRIRFAAQVDGDDAYLCHCRMCQRASGNVSLALKNVQQADVTWLHEPDWYESSAIARRPFCSQCGTTLGFQYVDNSDAMDITVASFDDPSGFRPVAHFGAESMHEAWIDTSDLKRDKANDYERLTERWAKVGKGPGGSDL